MRPACGGIGGSRVERLSGANLRLGRLFHRETGRSFVAAIDHGVTLGVPQGAERVIEAVDRVIQGEPDAILISPGVLEKSRHLFAHRGAPSAIVRCDWIINHPYVNDIGEGYRQLLTPAEALALGADAMILFLMVGAKEGAMFADNVRTVAAAAQEAHRIGLPLIVEAVLWGTRVEDKKDPDLLAFGCRMATELGRGRDQDRIHRRSRLDGANRRFVPGARAGAWRSEE